MRSDLPLYAWRSPPIFIPTTGYDLRQVLLGAIPTGADESRVKEQDAEHPKDHNEIATFGRE